MKQPRDYADRSDDFLGWIDGHPKNRLLKGVVWAVIIVALLAVPAWLVLS